MSVHGYCRISSDTQTTLSDQEYMIKKYCANNGFDQPQIYKDIGSAYNNKRRNEFENMIHNIFPNSKIIVCNVSRFTRKSTDIENILQPLIDKDIIVYSISENINSRDNYTLFINAIMLSEQESITISNRVREAHNIKRLKTIDNIITSIKSNSLIERLHPYTSSTAFKYLTEPDIIECMYKKFGKRVLKRCDKTYDGNEYYNKRRYYLESLRVSLIFRKLRRGHIIGSTYINRLCGLICDRHIG